MEANTEENIYPTIMTPRQPWFDNNYDPNLDNSITSTTTFINPSSNNPTTTFVENPNENDEALNYHSETIANHVIISDNVNNNNMGGLTREEWPFEYPPGYRFCPQDGELIVYYLQRKIMNLNLPHNKIKDVNLYSTIPHHLTATHEPVGDNEWYFFTPRDRKYRNGSRPNRAAGDGLGYWKATGADKPIKFNGELVGFRKALVFYLGKAPRGDKTNWIMHEFKVSEPTGRVREHENDMRLDDWVLCRIYNKEENKTPSSNVQVETDQPNPNPNSPEDEVIAQPPIPEIAQPPMIPEIAQPPPEIAQYHENHSQDISYMNADDELLHNHNNIFLEDFLMNYHHNRNSLDSILPPNTSHLDRPQAGMHPSFYNSESNDFQHDLYSDVKPFINPAPYRFVREIEEPPTMSFSILRVEQSNSGLLDSIPNGASNTLKTSEEASSRKRKSDP